MDNSQVEPAVCEWIDYKTKIHCFRLSERNKQTLFHNATVAASERLRGSKDFLSRLSKLSPEFASQFSVRDTAVSAAPFRLLVKPDNPLVSNPYYQISSYIVLSYCWHNSEWVPTPACQKGWWPVSDLMMGILQKRCESNEGIWIDQLCIHQDDAGEKSVAISSMDQIYKSARDMYVVIEDVELSRVDQQRALAFVSDSDISPADAAGFILKIASARLYSRAWCAYELKTTAYVLGRRILLAIGVEGGDVRDVWVVEGGKGFYPTSAVHEYMYGLGTRDETTTRQIHLYMQYVGFLEPIVRAVKREDVKSMELLSEFSVQSLNQIERLSCTLMEDYVPIMLHTSGLELMFTGVVKTKDELYWTISILALAAGDAGVLTAVGPRLLLSSDEQRKQDITSWVHNFTPWDWTIKKRIPDDSFINSVSERMIDLDLLIINDSPVLPSTAAMEYSIAFVEACYEVGCPTLSPYYRSSKMGVPKTKTAIALNVATILDLGLEWIASAWKIFQTELLTEGERWYKSADFEDPTIWAPTVTHLIPYLLRSSPKILISSPSLHRPLLVPFLSFFLSPHLRGNISHPSILRTGPSSIALFDSNIALPPIITLAIPACMASISFQRSMRVWVLEEIATDGSLPQTGRAGMAFLANQASRFGGEIELTDMVKTGGGGGETEVVKVVVKPGNIGPEDWDALGKRMTRNTLWEYVMEELKGAEALREMNQKSGTWRILGKGVLWGCGELVVDGDRVVLQRGQGVYGEAKMKAGFEEEETMEFQEMMAELIARDQTKKEEDTDDGVGDQSGDVTTDDQTTGNAAETSRLAPDITEKEVATEGLIEQFRTVVAAPNSKEEPSREEDELVQSPQDKHIIDERGDIETGPEADAKNVIDELNTRASSEALPGQVQDPVGEGPYYTIFIGR